MCRRRMVAALGGADASMRHRLKLARAKIEDDQRRGVVTAVVPSEDEQARWAEQRRRVREPRAVQRGRIDEDLGPAKGGCEEES